MPATLLGKIEDGEVIIDGAGQILAFDKGSEAIFGYLASEVIGQNVRVLMDEPHRTRHDSYLERYLET